MRLVNNKEGYHDLWNRYVNTVIDEKHSDIVNKLAMNKETALSILEEIRYDWQFLDNDYTLIHR